MSADQFRYKRPFSPDAETLEQLKEWDTPDLSDRIRKYKSTNAFNKTLPDPKQPEPAEDETSDEELSLQPLTAEQMETLRQQAYEAGFAEGKEEGFAKGYEEGRQQGQEDGTKQGLAEGKKLGLEQGKQQSEQQFQALEHLLDQLHQPLQQLDNEVEQALLALTLAMAKAVVQTEVTINPQVILQALQQAVDALPLRHGQVKIRLHPDDLAIIEQQYAAEQLAERGWQLQAEPTLSRGGCRLVTEQSSVDRTTEQRVQTALAHFLALETEPPESAAAEVVESSPAPDDEEASLASDDDASSKGETESAPANAGKESSS
ncbi:flagellar assembly protein FliH [Alkalimonas delamerensis]|uniref:Flagellar assembly protein FliH n=1 Tax=Alkalimonas delamerensis TaxID=265981 RepID=A0ABT9GMM6_9GAMM|nr:flagellar assembly protein FliH [Alkalimonas delamerensis]MDP4528228.1 flagellar assembly protein FliH [Alkalimonas delamerensis]